MECFRQKLSEKNKEKSGDTLNSVLQEKKG
jgi:hypothetical protein